MNNKKQYTVPVIKVVTFKVEDIFQSNGIKLSAIEEMGYNDKGMQDWTEGQSLFDNGWDN